MKTDDLIDGLAERLTPVKRNALPRALLLATFAGMVASTALMIASMNIRPDLADAVSSASFWLKFAYTLALTGAGFLLAERLARPAGRTGAGLTLAAVALGVILLAALAELAASPDAAMQLIMGSTWWFCVPAIVMISLPLFVTVFIAMRRFAPTKISGAGAAAGLLAGSAGAFVYGFHCHENAAPFVAVWYTLGMALMAGLGVFVSKVGALRW